MDFGRQWRGYRRSKVDEYIADQNDRITTLRLELERLRSSEPLLLATEEISSLLTSFAIAVSTTREQAERDAIATRRAAEEYAEGLKAETVRLCNEERARAAAQAEEVLRRAKEDIGALQQVQERVESALSDTAKGIFSLMELVEHVRVATPATVPTGTVAPEPAEPQQPTTGGPAPGWSWPPDLAPASPVAGRPPVPPGPTAAPSPPPPAPPGPAPTTGGPASPARAVGPAPAGPPPTPPRATSPAPPAPTAPAPTPPTAPPAAAPSAPPTPNMTPPAAAPSAPPAAPAPSAPPTPPLRPSGPSDDLPFDEVRVDPRDGMVVHFAPPPDPEPPAWPHAAPPGPAAHMVSGEAAEPQWHPPGHEDAAASSPSDGGREPEPPGP